MLEMLIFKFVLQSFFLTLALSQVTNLARRNPLLSRKKRYLMFPKNSNFVITMSYVKALMMVQPKGWNALGECDVPFPLPSDTRLFKKHRRNHYVQRRELLTGLESAFSQGGFDGSACVNRMICEAQQYVTTDRKSLVKDILSAIFISSEINSDEKYQQFCHDKNFLDCEIPFLSYILNSFFNS